MSDVYFKMRNIELSFEGKRVLHDFNLTVKKGEKVLLYGDSGGGKTSVLNLLMGFLRPHSGEIMFRGEHISKDNVWDIRRKIAYVPQSTDMSGNTVMELIETITGYRSNRDKCCSMSKTIEWLEYFDMSDRYLYKHFNELSGGEQQRVLIIISLILKREGFLLDEPTASLDTGKKNKVAELFTGHSDWTVIIVSHDNLWRESDNIRIIDMD